jgi:ech hydrogenase subunit B
MQLLEIKIPEIVLLLGFCSLFWTTNWVGMMILVAVTYFFEILIDNVSARMNWRWMLGYVWAMGLTLSLVNLVWLSIS